MSAPVLDVIDALIAECAPNELTQPDYRLIFNEGVRPALLLARARIEELLAYGPPPTPEEVEAHERRPGCGLGLWMRRVREAPGVPQEIDLALVAIVHGRVCWSVAADEWFPNDALAGALWRPCDDEGNPMPRMKP